MNRYRISFAGAGRVAEALCRELHAKGNSVIQISSREKRSGTEVATSCGAEWTDNLNFTRECDYILVSVPDNCLKKVLAELRYGGNPVVAHTAGSYGLEVFPGNIKNKGVFYPLQTFSKKRKINLGDVPFFLEASDARTMSLLKQLATTLSSKIYESDAVQRRMLHLAAVFACNFSNHMFTIAGDICKRTPYNFDVLVPLITETVNKAVETGPEFSQTGPAVRNDKDTVKKHLELLSFSERMKRIYKEITNSIIEYYRVK